MTDFILATPEKKLISSSEVVKLHGVVRLQKRRNQATLPLLRDITPAKLGNSTN
jgi:hypothetical protein